MAHAPVYLRMKPVNGIDENDFELDEEFESWEWVRTAGVSAEALREALRKSHEAADVPIPKIAKAA